MTAKKTAAKKQPPPGAGVSDSKAKPVAIFGTTPSRMEGPVNDESWDRWTIGPGGMDMHGWERLYEVHGMWPENFAEYLDTLSKWIDAGGLKT